MAGEPPGYQIMGNDYYGRNEHIMKPDGSMCPAEGCDGLVPDHKELLPALQEAGDAPETNVFDPDNAPTWLWKQWINILQMRTTACRCSASPGTA
jgi:hypothetical protein